MGFAARPKPRAIPASVASHGVWFPTILVGGLSENGGLKEPASGRDSGGRRRVLDTFEGMGGGFLS